ncbi:MAG: hypothetical protein GY803_12805, partial [Chloroflexi bacterium]|nr:hypothetical protein [Chloroflexota bacterium]
MTRDIGDLAENKLIEWTIQAGITANKAYKDREGWDFILQFPFPELEVDIPLDRRDSRIECWVQVKGREAAKKSKSIKLSNWEKLIRSPLPAFFLIFDFGKENDPRNAYLVHVGEKWINIVLRKLRKFRSDDT